jgi:OmpA-OmpF porin, OOP family
MKFRILTLALLTGVFSSTLHAQTTTSPSGEATGSGYSWLPYTTSGYFGINLGRPNFKGNCDARFSCEDSSFAGKIYTGGLVRDNVGLELGYLYLGSAERFGGKQRAQGINLVLVGNLPMSDVMNLTGRVGTTYAWTRTSTSPIAGVVNGDQNDFGLTYGIGIGFDVNPQNQISLDWDRHRVDFATGEQDIDLFTLGWKYKF